MLLLNVSAILSWASRPTCGSEKAIDGAPLEESSLVHPHVAGLFSAPVEINASVNYEASSSIDFGLNKATEKRSDVSSSPKNHKHPHGYRLTANLVNRIHARPVRLGERGLSQKVGALWKEIRINERRLQKRLTNLLRSVQLRGS